jgi:uncharacterized protein
MKSESNLFPSLPQAALLILASFLLRYVFALALFDFRDVLGLTPYQLDALSMVLAYGLLLAVVTHYRGMTYRDLVHPAKSSLAATVLLLVPPVVLLVPLLFLVTGALQNLVMHIFPLSRWEEQAFSHMLAMNLAAIVASCVLAPMFEEMLFRGVLLRGFLARYPKGQAIAASAFLFGVAHLNIYQFILAFLLGLVLGWLFERSRSLIPCIALHATFNSMVVASDQIFGSESSLGDVSLLVWAAALVAAFFGTIALARVLGGFGIRTQRNAV